MASADANRDLGSGRRGGGTPNLEEPAIVALRIAILLGCASTLVACAGMSSTPPQSVGAARMAVSNGTLPSNVEPGRLLKPGLGTGGGIDPIAQLDASVRDRSAWAPLRADTTDLSAIAKTRNASRAGSEDSAGPHGMASTPPARGQDATMDRLEREGQQRANPICANC